MKKKIFQFPDGGADAVFFWIDEAGEIGADSDDANALNYVETANLTRKIDFGSPDLYAHIFYEYDSDYEDAFFTLVSVTRGATPPCESVCRFFRLDRANFLNLVENKGLRV